MPTYQTVIRESYAAPWTACSDPTADLAAARAEAGKACGRGEVAEIWVVAGRIPVGGSTPGLPGVAVCGHGRAGKDTAGKFLASVTPLRYVGSLSWVGKGVVAAKLGLCEQEAWDTRHTRRREWYEILNEYRRERPARLIEDSLALGELVVGVRDGAELKAALSAGLVAHAVWVENPGVPPDPTTTYGPGDCTAVVRNDSTVEAFHGRLREWAAAAGIPLLS